MKHKYIDINEVPSTHSATTKRIPLWEKILKCTMVIAFMLVPLLGIYGFILFTGIVIITFMLPTAQSRFMRYQQTLPTSKIRSMSIGIVELKGKLLSQQQIKAPLSEQQCIGYYYTISREERDKDGHTHYRLIHEEKRCQPFWLKDNTGKVQVDTKNLDFHLLPVNKTVRCGREIKEEYLLEQRTNYLLIGQVVRRGNELVITRDRLRRIFGIAPCGNLQRRSKMNLVLKRARYFIIVTALAMVLILVAPIEVQRHQVVIHLSQWLPFTSFFPSNFGGIQ